MEVLKYGLDKASLLKMSYHRYYVQIWADVLIVHYNPRQSFNIYKYVQFIFRLYQHICPKFQEIDANLSLFKHFCR